MNQPPSSRTARSAKRPAAAAVGAEPAKRMRTTEIAPVELDVQLSSFESDLSDMDDDSALSSGSVPQAAVLRTDGGNDASNEPTTTIASALLWLLICTCLHSPSASLTDNTPTSAALPTQVNPSVAGTPTTGVADAPTTPNVSAHLAAPSTAATTPAADSAVSAPAAPPSVAPRNEAREENIDNLVLPAAMTEARAVALLQGLGVEPGVLVGLDLSGLNGLYQFVLRDRLAAARRTEGPVAHAVATLPAVMQPLAHGRVPLAPALPAPPAPVPLRVPDTRNSTLPAARTEAEAVAQLNALGFEPGALVGLDLQALNALHGAVLHGKTNDSAPQTTGVTRPVAGPSSVVLSAALPVAHASARSVTRTDLLKSLAGLNIPEDRVTHLNDTELGRVHAIVAYCDKTRNIYPLEAVTVGMDWGVATSFNNMANYMCEKGTSKAITFWVVGAVTFGHWFSKDGLAADRIAMGIQPLSTTASATCKTLLDTSCVPRNSSYVAAGFGADQIKATRWMTVKAQNGKPATVLMFTDFYNASTALRDKASLEKLAVDALKPYDLVLVEARIGRHTTDPVVKGKPRAMDNFQAFFNLESLYLLKSAPSTAAAAAPSDFVL
ncbi:hypothetical protein K438DRAFT_1978787 [Mycena galopus ATCC 62051]|nr:hypothetical protein K438DRAFT_1978787 [Mycena galopus ATCC 62051]